MIRSQSECSRQVPKACTIAKLEDIPKLYKALKDQDDNFIWNKIIIDHPDHVYCGQFIKNEKNILTVKISVFINTYSHTTNENLTKNNTTLLNPRTEWFYQSKVWFKKNKYGEHNYDTFMSYIEPYREPIQIDLSRPIVAFVIEF